jgi:hypothetical protein
VTEKQCHTTIKIKPFLPSKKECKVDCLHLESTDFNNCGLTELLFILQKVSGLVLNFNNPTPTAVTSTLHYSARI